MHIEIEELSVWILRIWGIKLGCTAREVLGKLEHLNRLGPNKYWTKLFEWGIIQPRDFKNDKVAKPL